MPISPQSEDTKLTCVNFACQFASICNEQMWYIVVTWRQALELSINRYLICFLNSLNEQILPSFLHLQCDNMCTHSLKKTPAKHRQYGIPEVVSYLGSHGPFHCGLPRKNSSAKLDLFVIFTTFWIIIGLCKCGLASKDKHSLEMYFLKCSYSRLHVQLLLYTWHPMSFDI